MHFAEKSFKWCWECPLVSKVVETLLMISLILCNYIINIDIFFYSSKWSQHQNPKCPSKVGQTSIWLRLQCIHIHLKLVFQNVVWEMQMRIKIVQNSLKTSIRNRKTHTNFTVLDILQNIQRKSSVLRDWKVSQDFIRIT